MNSNLELDQARALLTQHSRSKLNGHFPSQVTHQYELTNPICGDHVRLKLNIQAEQITEIGFFTQGCAICSASASLLSEVVQGQSIVDTLNIAQSFEESLVASLTQPWPIQLHSLKSFEHLKINPARKACALLPWVALRSAVKEIL